jgi:chromosome segregation ATPase
MRTREKIYILLAGISLVLGTFIYIHFQSNEVEANYFRWLFANNIKYSTSSPMRFIAEELPPGTLLYGGLSLFALVVLIVVLKMLRDGELLALRTRLMDILAAKSQTESLLQEEVWKGRNERQAKDYVTKDLEASIDRIEKLIGGLNEKEKLLKSRDTEIMTLRTRAVEQQDPGPTWDTAGRSLRAELKNQAESLEASHAVIKELEARLGAKTRLWESQLREKDALVKRRDGDLVSLRSELQGLSERFDEMEAAKKRAEHLLQEEIVQKKTLLEANELVTKNEEKRLRERMRALEVQLGHKEKLLRGRDSEISTLQRQTTELAAAKEELEGRLQDEIGSADKDRYAREALIKESEQKYGATISSLQNEVAKKDLLLQVSDNDLRALKAEVKAVHAQLNVMSAAKQQGEGSLQEDLRKERQRRLVQEAANSELEQRYARDLEILRSRVSEKDESLKHHDGELKSLKAQLTSLAEQLTRVEAVKERATGALEEQIRKERQIRQASDSASRTLEENFKARISLLEKQLSEKQQAAGNQDSSEVGALQSELKSLNRRLEDLAAAKDKAERLLQEALREKTDLVRSKEAADKEIESTLTGKLRTLESRLHENAALLQDRDLELSAVKKQVAALSAAKDQAALSLQEAAKQNTELLRGKDSALKALESRFDEIIRSLETQLSGKEDLLESRDAELKAMGSKVGALTAQLAEIDRIKDQGARLLRDELRQKTELLQVKESAAKKLEERFVGQIRALENQLSERLNLLETRDSEIDALMAKVSELTQERAEVASERDKSDRLVQEELREKSALLQAKESSIGEVKEQMSTKIQSLERQLMEKQKVLESSGTELGELRSQVYVLTERLGEAEGAKVRAESLLHEERKKAEHAQFFAEPAAPQNAHNRLNGESHGLDRLVSERDELLKARDKLIQDLMNELKEKKTALAKHEIEVWRGIERRDAWKHRLSKIGIRLKD